MRHSSLFSLLAAVWLLSACMPALDESKHTIEIQTTEPLHLPKASTTQVSVSFPPRYFGHDLEDIEDITDRFDETQVKRGDRPGTAYYISVVDDFRVKEVSIPENWKVSLEKADFVRTLVSRAGNRIAYGQHFEFTFAVTLPADVSERRKVILITMESTVGDGTIPISVYPSDS